MALHRYWIKFKGSMEELGPLTSGCGVTAANYEDALAIIRQYCPSLPQVHSVVEDIDVSALDNNHILPNIGNVLRRGVWFPKFE